jgi:hypothetical protein
MTSRYMDLPRHSYTDSKNAKLKINTMELGNARATIDGKRGVYRGYAVRL